MQNAILTDKGLWAPIPQNQIDMQPGVLIQNPGY